MIRDIAVKYSLSCISHSFLFLVTKHNFYKATKVSKAKMKQGDSIPLDPRTIRPIGSTGIMPSFAHGTKASDRRCRSQNLVTQAIDSSEGTLAPRYADGTVCKEANAKTLLSGRKFTIRREAIRRGASSRGNQSAFHDQKHTSTPWVGLNVPNRSCTLDLTLTAAQLSSRGGRKPFTQFFTKAESPSKAIRIGVAGDKERPSRSSHLAVYEISP